MNFVFNNRFMKKKSLILKDIGFDETYIFI